MNDEPVLMEIKGSTSGMDTGRPTEFIGEREHLEWSVMVLGDECLRTQSFPGGLDVFLPAGAPERREITLSSSQLMVGMGSAIGSMFLFVWALTKLWLSGT